MQEINEMVENGYAAQKISIKLGLSFEYVKEFISKNKLQIKKEPFNDSLIEYIINLYKNGVSAKNLGIKYSIDKRRIQKWVQGKGIERSRNESHRITFFNEHYFDKVDTADKAYWLGFLYADAYNCKRTNTISLSLQTQDRGHLDKLSTILALPTDKITYTKTDLEYEYYTLKIYSKHMCDVLEQLGCPQAKSFIIKYPEWISNHLHNHFIRGLFDGDGCITFRKKQKEWKWSIASTKEMCESINNILYSELKLSATICYISKTDNNTYEIQTGGNEKIHKIMEWFYVNSNLAIRLDRKFNKYNDLIKQQQNRNINRLNYLLSENIKYQIVNDRQSNKEIAKKYKINAKTVSQIKNQNSYSKIVHIDGKLLTAPYIKTLSSNEREKLVLPLFEHFRKAGWIYPIESRDSLMKSWNKLLNFNPDIKINEIFNNSSLATNICKFFCKSFYNTTERDKLTMIELWNDDKFLTKLIRNRLVLDWHSKTNETFNISHRMMIQGMRSMRAISSITIFKPGVAKYIYMKYSNIGDLVGDFSCGFGGRLLGAMACGRRYIGTDPLTVPELNEMVKFFNFDNIELIHGGSEHFIGQENSIDLFFSSPPYYDQEFYSDDKTQAYNNGEDYFYNVYWAKTLENIKYMLKPNKCLALNVKNEKMLNMTREYFGQEIEKNGLRTIRSHLTKQAGVEKYEYIYIFNK